MSSKGVGIGEMVPDNAETLLWQRLFFKAHAWHTGPYAGQIAWSAHYGVLIDGINGRSRIELLASLAIAYMQKLPPGHGAPDALIRQRLEAAAHGIELNPYWAAYARTHFLPLLRFVHREYAFTGEPGAIGAIATICYLRLRQAPEDVRRAYLRSDN